ncbi:MAG: hypothetical protein H7Y00_06525 [Fimbriimonadaceae bacterium]|nr:hypothetical protein [Chitinophagales bacterium]
MKKMIRITSFACLLTFLFISNNAFTQAVTPKAKFDPNLVIELDPSATLSAIYEIDITAMSFKDENAAKIFFRTMTDNLVNVDLNYAEKKAMLNLHTQYKEAWTIAEWNDYLYKNAERYRLAYNRVNAE